MQHLIRPYARSAETGVVSEPPSLRVVEGPAQPGPLGRLSTSPYTRAFLLIAGWKLATALILALAYFLLPFSVLERAGNDLIYPPQEREEVNLESHFATWDSAHYLYLADNGYSAGIKSNAYAPVYPLTIRALRLVTGSNVLAGMLIANAASIAALMLFYRFVRRIYGDRTAFKALVLFIAFPTSFFLSVIYSEGLFLFLAMVLFTGLHEKKWGWVAFAGFLLPLTRFLGVLAVVPMAIFLVAPAISVRRQACPQEPDDRFRHELKAVLIGLWPRALVLLAPVAGAFASFAYMKATTGDWFAAQHVAATYISGWHLAYVVDPLHLFRIFFAHPVWFLGTNNPVDRAFFVGFLAAIPLVYRRVDKPLFAWYLLMGLQPLLGSFMSYTRYMMLCFPVYIAWGNWLASKGPFAMRVSLYPLVILQVCFTALHFNDFWVA